MDILLLGGLFRNEKEEEIINNSIGNIQNAANAFQWNMVNGLIENKVNLSVLSLVYVGSFPKLYKKIYVRGEQIKNKDIKYWKYCGFINVFGIKHIFRTISATYNLFKWCKNNESNKKYVMVYAMHTPFMIAAYICKKLFKTIKTTIIIPDLPEYMDLSEEKSNIKNMLKKIDITISNKLIKNFDNYVVLTKYMIDKLNINEKDAVIIEGISNSTAIKNKIKSNKDMKSILYTGTLNKAYGIMELLKAFSKIKNSNYELWICGEGEAKEDIINMSKIDKRIKYFGLLKRSEVLQIQSEADVLINPRKAEGEFTKYSFPSKLMEYMASGTPSIVYPLKGMPKEYEDYFYIVEGNSVKDLENKILEVCSNSKRELEIKGINAREFVKKNKNPKVQTQKILDLIK